MSGLKHLNARMQAKLVKLDRKMCYQFVNYHDNYCDTLGRIMWDRLNEIYFGFIF